MDRWEDWQKPYQFGALVIWPPDEVREIVNAQRQEYDPVSQSYCEAHITVTQPLTRDLKGHEWSQVLGILQEHDRFEIRYGPLNSFLPYPCIWYEIEPREKVLELRHALHKTGYFNLRLSHTDDFIPHMTITEGASGPTVDQELLERLQATTGCGSFVCNELSWIVPKEEFSFGVVRNLPLKHPSNGDGAQHLAGAP